MNKPVNNISVTLSDAIPPKDIGPFSFTTSGAPANSFPGAVRLSSQKQQVLVVDFELLNDRYLEQNTYTDDNSAMWNQEVFEIFISAGAETPTRYMEIELNPNGALFSAWVTNSDGTGSNNTLALFDGRGAGISTSVLKRDNSWHGKIKIPLSLLGNVQDHYRINFFRIVSLQAHVQSSSWSCTADSCAFLAWSPTLSGDVPNFHIPACFGHLNLK
ncbi:carbohydrate-binding family 9-like protein [Gammaproteobacteria bacterium]|nr:carbohydrate-binding family 9-like protein [Gammaproteobacteria bacterium]